MHDADVYYYYYYYYYGGDNHGYIHLFEGTDNIEERWGLSQRMEM
jgi:hypothetical protein